MNVLRTSSLILAALLLTGMAQKQAMTIRFHIEAKGQEGAPFSMPVKFMNPPREGFMSSVPSISERNIVAIYPVQNASGSWGCAFKLDEDGRIGLETLSREHSGASMVAFVATKTGTHQVIDVVIDKPVTDGILYLPYGFTANEIEMFKKRFQLFGPGASVPKKKGK